MAHEAFPLKICLEKLKRRKTIQQQKTKTLSEKEHQIQRLKQTVFLLVFTQHNLPEGALAKLPFYLVSVVENVTLLED